VNPDRFGRLRARWNFTESVIVKELMLQDALHLQRATLPVIVRRVFRIGNMRGGFYLHDSVGAYHPITKRLLALYRTSHAGLYPRLAEVLGDGPPTSDCQGRELVFRDSFHSQCIHRWPSRSVNSRYDAGEQTHNEEYQTRHT